MEKGKSKYKKSYSFFIKVIRKEFNKLNKVFAEFIDEKMLSLVKLNLKHC